MLTRAQIEASRRNGRLSSGPKTAAGKSRSRMNALKHGGFADGPVVAAGWEAFRDAVVADLAPEGAVEYRLAVRVAELQWRLLRMTRIEAAAISPNLDGLPPEPTTVGEAQLDAGFRPPPVHTPAEIRLTWVRGQTRGGRRAAANIRATADRLADRTGAGDPEMDFWITGAVARAAGWGPDELAGRLKSVRVAVGLDPDPLVAPAGGWTGELFRRIVTAAAGIAGVEPDRFFSEVMAALGEEAREADARAAEAEAEEADLVRRMTADRERALALRALPPAGLSEQLVRVEVHLGKQLDMALRQLDRLQARRPPAQPPVAVAGAGISRSAGFDLEKPELVLPGRSEAAPRLAVVWPNQGAEQDADPA